jgi:uncharacterized protein (UPF0332 family)
MTDKDALSAELKKMINKSERALKTAKENFLNGDYESASSRAYYSVFHIKAGAI